VQIALFIATSGVVLGIIAKLGAVSRKLAVSERRYKSLVQSSNGFVWITDAKGVSQAKPDQWEMVTGRSEYQQGDWAALIHPEDLKDVTGRFLDAGTRRASYTAEFRMISKDGSYRWFATRAVPILSADNSILEWVGLTYDIDAAKMAETKLEATVADRTAQLKATIEELESFSYSVSHDLRGPLRVMQSFAEALEEDCRDDISATGRDYVRRIVAAAERMDCVIQDVLVYSRMTRGELPLEPVALDGFVSNLLDGYPGFRGADADIRVEGPLPVVVGNQAALTQALANLIGNALKFVAPGVRAQVRIFARQADSRAFVSIADNGIGIPEDARAAIFGLFFRADHQYEGTGIGLATARRAVERMGGQISVESELGRGSTFTLDLSLAQSEVAKPGDNL
jgi:PAS domain S-box-containing protein